MSVPAKLSENHKLMAFMVAAGMKNSEIAKQLHCNAARISVIKSSPLFKTLVAQHQREMTTYGVKNAMDKLLGDAPYNVDFIRSVRDGEFADPEDARVRLSAAGMLFDRQIPRKSEDGVKNSLTITVEHAQKQLAQRVCDEIGDPIDVESTHVEDSEVVVDDQLQWSPPPPEPIVVRALDDVVAELRQQEMREGD
jgi:hypothetical protein